MTTRYAVMTNGIGRCATKWLAQMLERNTRGTYVTHEGFRDRKQWLAAEWEVKAKHHGLLVDFSADPLALVHSFKFNPMFCVLLRDPIDIARTYITRMITGTHVSPDLATKRSVAYHYMTHYLWALDSSIFLAKDTGLDVSYWDYEKYTTLDGFVELAEYIGAVFHSAPQLVPPNDTKPQHQKIDIVEWCDGDTAILKDRLSGFPHAKEAYEQVWSDQCLSSSLT